MHGPSRATLIHPAGRAGGLPPPWRVPLLVLGFVALIVGTTAGLARLGWPMPALSASAAGWHGPLMICGFFGVVIGLERAVAIGSAWAYVGPLLSGAGSLVALSVAAGGGIALHPAVLYLAGSAVLLAASLQVVHRQPALFTVTLAFGAACWAAGNALWLAGWGVHEVVPWWLAFLVLTIAGERLELSRFLPPSPAARRVFIVVLGATAMALAATRTAWGAPLLAAAWLALALWLLRQDIARRTVRGQGLTRFIAVCLLSGYGWLAVAAAVMLGAGPFVPGTPAWDAALHALALGFVFSMVFGHAPIIFPAVLRVAVPYHPYFYAPLLLLHVSLLLRLAGDAGAGYALLRGGALLNALALLAFVAGMVTAVVRGRRAPASASR